MSVEIEHARVEVKSAFWRQGSVLAETIRSGCEGITTRLLITSSAPPHRVAALVRNAENGCYTLQTIRNPVPATTEVELNGAALDYMNIRE